jgi:hypothetical protein
MKITIIALFMVCATALTTLGQSTYSIKGTTADTLGKTKLTTTVTVLNAKDSILQTFTHAAADGSFNLPIDKPGTYLLWVTFPGYASYEEKFVISNAVPMHNFGNINLQDRAKLLQEVVIKGEATAIKIKGDTTVYNARAFVIQPNDKVEDLLKQLPDVQVDKDGKITAQGEKVPKVYVDGEEFFGDDPLLVTRNLRADMVDKVEIYNKKSDQAAFTGIDDGKTTKAINIKLREDKKNGVFGKVVGGVSNNSLYDGQAMFNKFKGKFKLSAYGTTSNTGKNGLNGDDASRLGATSSSMVIFDDGGNAFISGDDYDNASYSGSGIPKSATAGVHYDTKWNEDKESINSNYRVSSLSLNTTRDVEQQQNYTDFASNKSSLTNSYNSTFKQKADMIYLNNFNTNTSLRFSADGTIKSTDNSLDTKSSNIKDDGTLINNEVRSEKTNGDQKLFNAAFIFNKKFKKARRTISWNVSEAFSQTDSRRFVNGIINTPASSTPQTILKQYQPVHSVSSVLNSNMSYTEPLSAKLSVALNYGLGFNNAISDRESYAQASPNTDPYLSLNESDYTVLDPKLTNNYKFNQLTNQLGALFNYRGTKVTLTFGTRATDVNLNQTDQITKNVYKRSYLNWSPQATFRYSFGPSTNYSLSYSGSTSQPRIEQIQPVRVNTDPLNITIGNPNLGPSFSHRFSTSYSMSKSISGQYLSFSGSYSFSENPMITRTDRDPSTGGITNQTVNLSDKTPYSYSFSSDISRRILGGITAELYLTSSYNLGYSYNNGSLSTDGRRSFNASLYLQKNEVKKYGVSVSGGPNYTIYTYSARSESNSRPFGYNISASGNVYLPGKFQIASDIRYAYTGSVPNIPGYDTKMLNASIIKTFLKGDNLKFTITGNNLFNQDVISRGSGPTGITQTRTNNILRYFMLTVSWDFTKFGTTSAPAQN